MDVAGDFPRSADGVGEAGGVGYGFHPLAGLVSWEEGEVEDADAKSGKVIDRRKEATGGGGNAAFEGEAIGKAAGDDRPSKFGFAGWSARAGRSHAKGLEDGFTVDGSDGFACDVGDCDPKQHEAVVGVSWSCPG